MAAISSLPSRHTDETGFGDHRSIEHGDQNLATNPKKI
jgi:hypothetical protein